MTEQQLNPPHINTSPYESPMHNFPNSINTLTNPENEVYKLELTLRSMKLDVKGNPVFCGDPLLNEAGIVSIIGQVQALVNQVTIMSNFNDDDIPKMIDFIGDTIAKDLMMNRVKYGITNVTARDRIFFASLSTVFVTMKRALDEGEKRFWKGSQQEILMRSEGASSGKKSGLLSSFMNSWKS